MNRAISSMAPSAPLTHERETPSLIAPLITFRSPSPSIPGNLVSIVRASGALRLETSRLVVGELRPNSFRIAGWSPTPSTVSSSSRFLIAHRRRSPTSTASLRRSSSASESSPPSAAGLEDDIALLFMR